MPTVRGTGADAHSEYAAIRSELEVVTRAHDYGRNNRPEPTDTSPDANELHFRGFYNNKLRLIRQSCTDTLGKFSQDRQATAANINIDQAHAALERLANGIEPELALLKQQNQKNLEDARYREERALLDLRYFKEKNNLTHPAKEQPDLLWHFSLVVLFAFIEWISLSIFYAEGSDYGLIGGILMAVALSLVTIGLAVLCGGTIRYLNHIHLIRKILALFGAVLLLTLFVFAVGFAAHYRVAVNEVAASAPTTPINPISQPQSFSKTSPSTESDQWKASKLAIQNYKSVGFLFEDALTWLLVILIIMFAIISVWKGYSIDDPYPGYGPATRVYMETRNHYNIAKDKHTVSVNGVFQVTDRKQSEIIKIVRDNIEYYEELSRKSREESNDFTAKSNSLQELCNMIVMDYRNENRKVATGTAPAYFQDLTQLDNNLMTDIEPLSVSEISYLEIYRKGMDKIIQFDMEYDNRRQQLRTTTLNSLGGFFNTIERMIQIRAADEVNRIPGA